MTNTDQPSIHNGSWVSPDGVAFWAESRVPIAKVNAVISCDTSSQTLRQENIAGTWGRCLESFETLKSLSDNITLLKIVTRANIQSFFFAKSLRELYKRRRSGLKTCQTTQIIYGQCLERKSLLSDVRLKADLDLVFGVKEL